MVAEVFDKGNTAVVVLKGRLDTLTTREASEIFEQVAATHDEVILDMAEAGYVSSAGIRALKSLYMIMYKKGGSLKMENLGENVYSVLEMTGLLDMIELKKKD